MSDNMEMEQKDPSVRIASGHESNNDSQADQNYDSSLDKRDMTRLGKRQELKVRMCNVGAGRDKLIGDRGVSASPVSLAT